MSEFSRKRIAAAITRHAPGGPDASGMLVECLTDAVCGITKILQEIDVTIAEGFGKIAERRQPIIITAEEVNAKHLASEFEQRQQNDRTWPFSDKLLCHWIKWTPVASGVLELYLPEGEHCDMRGAISVGKSLMPDVVIIATYSGKDLDTTYNRLEKRWSARSYE